MKVMERYLEKALEEGGSRSDFGDYMHDAIDYLGRAMNEALKEGIPELKKLQKTMDFLQKLERKYKQ